MPLPAATRWPRPSTLRIALACPYDLGVPGGVQAQVQGMAAAYAAAGHEVVVVAPGEPWRDGAPAGVEVHCFGSSHGISANGSVAPVGLSWRAARRATALLEASDVAHVHEPFAPLLAWPAMLHRRHRELLVATFHRSSTAAYDRWLAPLARPLAKRIDVAVAVSPEAARTATTLCALDPGIIPNGVVLPPSLPTALRERRVCFVGRHEERKGLRVLLEAHELLGGEVELAIVGEGPQTEALAQRYPEGPRRRWLGRVSDAERDELLATSAIYCAPSLGGESFGIVLLEAMGAGAAVVASDIPGYAAAAGGHATLSPAGDAAALAEALRATLLRLEDGGAAGSAREAAFSYAQAFAMSSVASAYLERFAAGLAEGAARPQG